jgi:hypothetical protein
MLRYFRQKTIIKRLRANALELGVDLGNLTDKEIMSDLDIVERRLDIAHEECLALLDAASKANKEFVDFMNNLRINHSVN